MLKSEKKGKKSEEKVTKKDKKWRKWKKWQTGVKYLHNRTKTSKFEESN